MVENDNPAKVLLTLSRNLAVTCFLCFGTKKNVMGGNTYDCTSCADVDAETVRFCLGRLTEEQITFLRFGAHTLAEQPCTEDEHRTIARCEYFVDVGDDVYSGEYDGYEPIILLESTKHWFASGKMTAGAGRNRYYFRYNPLGLHLRAALICAMEA
jgi:hypothetical protein